MPDTHSLTHRTPTRCRPTHHPSSAAHTEICPFGLTAAHLNFPLANPKPPLSSPPAVLSPPPFLMSLVDDPQVRAASLHTPVPLPLRPYVAPFIGAWGIFAAVYLTPSLYAEHIGAREWTFVAVASIASVQALLWLLTKWNVRLAAAFDTVRAPALDAASLILVQPVENAGAADFCPLVRDRGPDGAKRVSFVFQKRRFLFFPDRGLFAPLAYPIDADPRPSIGFFQSARGLSSADVAAARRHYGDNTFDIPVPGFLELFKEHAVAPFFVFQVFCVGLWLLDEYWYYSLFTLFMLVVFESTVVWQRQRTLSEFRSMSIQPYDVWVYRDGAWTSISSAQLLPGDLVSVNRTRDDSGVACDMLMVEGNAIVNEAMLSGESTPLLKDSVQLRPATDRVDVDGLDKNSLLWGGTKVLQIAHPADTSGPVLASGIPRPPDNGAVGVAIKTGFDTSQGSLVRTMIFSTEHVSANNAEAFLFIFFLLIFALAAAWYVWQEGVANDRKRSKLLLDCVLIITSVVPPELPMELSLAVNSSLAALSRHAIFCTEPFRIPFAGRVDVACFDKTGTLTGEDLVVDGVAGLAPGTAITPVSELPADTTLVLATAHALVKLDDGEIVGDPMEKATLSSLGWSLGADDTLSAADRSASVQIKRRFQFSSALKRQSAVAHVRRLNKSRATVVGVKGAPETIRTMLVSTPPDYEQTFKHFSRNGARVLALGYKVLSDAELGQSRINALDRHEVESGLTFAGFLILQCPLKPDALRAVRALNENSHRVIMITGDNPLTAVHVARKVEIVDRDVLILDAPEDSRNDAALVWRSIDDRFVVPVNPDHPIDTNILASNDLCLTGHALACFAGKPALPDLLRHTWVYARVSPKQKEDILLGLKDAGYTTLMCGDGTNDVGALKQAHVGVALLNGTPEDLDRIAEHFRNGKMKEIYEKQCDLMRRFNQPAPPVPPHIAHLYPPGPTNPHFEKAVFAQAERRGITPPQGQAQSPGQSRAQPQQLSVEQQRNQQASQAASGFADKLTQSMMASELEDSEPPTIKLGDASVAAPFTSKLANVVAIPNIIRQGRCTLVATIQMYKILALNCLISAYSLSVIYLDGIKFGDGQVTISGMLMSVCFLSISRAKVCTRPFSQRPFTPNNDNSQSRRCPRSAHSQTSSTSTSWAPSLASSRSMSPPSSSCLTTSPRLSRKWKPVFILFLFFFSNHICPN